MASTVLVRSTERNPSTRTLPSHARRLGQILALSAATAVASAVVARGTTPPASVPTVFADDHSGLMPVTPARTIPSLHEAFVPTKASLSVHRDVFAFRAGVEHPRPPERHTTPERHASGEGPFNAEREGEPGVVFTLIGIAAEPIGGEMVRTAIVSAPGILYLAKEGEPLGSQYIVATITDDAADVRNGVTGVTRRLTFK
jgi:hypothetical protein